MIKVIVCITVLQYAYNVIRIRKGYAMQKRFSLYLKERNEMEKLLKEEKLVLSSEVFEDCFWEKYIGTDKNFTFPLKNYYKGSSSFQLTLVIITEVVAYDPVRRKPTCKTLADIVKQAVRGHSWVPENVCLFVN